MNNIEETESPKKTYSLVCPTQIRNINFYSLVDSACKVSLISEKLHNKIKNSKHVSNITTHDIDIIPLKSITGQKLTSLARATIQSKIGKRNVRHTFQIVQGLPKSAILGIDFLENHKLLLDFHQRTLCVKG